MKNILIGSVVGGLVLFVWGFLFWGLSPIPYMALSRATPDDAAAGQALLQHFPQTGTYVIPGTHNPTEQLEALHQAGPIAFVFFNREGKPLMSPAVLATGLVHAIVFAFLVALALNTLGAALPSYGARVRLLVFVGLGSALWGPIGTTIWWYYPPAWQWWVAFADFVSWLLLALVLARIVRPQARAA